MEDGAQEIFMSIGLLNIAIFSRQYGDTIGGVERASIRLANEMAAREHVVHIISLDLPNASMAFPLDSKVRWHKVAKVSAKHRAGWSERLQRQIAIRQVLLREKIDVTIGFQDGAYLTLLTSAIGTGIPVIAAERNSPSRFDHLSNKKARDFVFNSFRFAARITVQCPSYRDMYPAYLKEKIVLIPNSVDPAEEIADPEGLHASIKEILFVGRLDYQKNPEVLLSAFAILTERYPDWRLRFVGGGPYEEKLKAQAAALGIVKNVIFEGFQTKVDPYLAKAQIFCLPSLWEGFPNALGEAMAHGLPAVGFEKCSGVRDLIEHGKTGILVEGSNDTAALAEGLGLLIASAARRRDMGAAGIAAMRSYTPEKVYERWETLFRDVTR